MRKSAILWIVVLFALGLTACGSGGESATRKESVQTERLMQEAVAQTGMPAIKNFREKKILKMILEMRDQENVRTYTYTIAEQTGRLIYVGESIGFALPAATQYTNPQRASTYDESYQRGSTSLPQADPNGLYSPQSAEGSWVLMVDPESGKPRPVYFEPRIAVSTFKLKNATY